MQNIQPAVAAPPSDRKSQWPEGRPVSREGKGEAAADPVEELLSLNVPLAHSLVAALAHPWNHLDFSYKPRTDGKSGKPDESDAAEFEAAFERLPVGALGILQKHALRQDAGRGITELSLRTGKPELAFRNLRELENLEKITLQWPHRRDLDLRLLDGCGCNHLREVGLLLPAEAASGLTIMSSRGIVVREMGPNGARRLPPEAPARAVVQYWVKDEDGGHVPDGSPVPLERLADLRERMNFKGAPLDAGRDEKSEPGLHSKRVRVTVDHPPGGNNSDPYSTFKTIPAQIRDLIAAMAMEDPADVAGVTLSSFLSGRRNLDEVAAFKRDYGHIRALDGIVKDRKEYEEAIGRITDFPELCQLIDQSNAGHIPRQLLDEELWLFMVNEKGLLLENVGLRNYGRIFDTAARTPRVCAAAFRREGPVAFNHFPGGPGYGPPGPSVPGRVYLNDRVFMRGLIREMPSIVTSLPMDPAIWPVVKRAAHFDDELVGAIEGGIPLSEFDEDLRTERVCLRALHQLLEKSDYNAFISALKLVPIDHRWTVTQDIEFAVLDAISKTLAVSDLPWWVRPTNVWSGELSKFGTSEFLEQLKHVPHDDLDRMLSQSVDIEKLFIAAVLGKSLAAIPDAGRSPWVCALALAHGRDGLVDGMKFVPGDLRPEVFRKLAALDKNNEPITLRDLATLFPDDPEWMNEAVYESAVGADMDQIADVPENLRLPVLIAALSDAPKSITAIALSYLPMEMRAAPVDADEIDYCTHAMNNGWDAIQYVPEDRLTEFWANACKDSEGLALAMLRNADPPRTWGRCMDAAVASAGDALEYLPHAWAPEKVWAFKSDLYADMAGSHRLSMVELPEGDEVLAAAMLIINDNEGPERDAVIAQCPADIRQAARECVLRLIDPETVARHHALRSQ